MFDDIGKILHGEEKDEGVGEPVPAVDPPEELVIAYAAYMVAKGEDYGNGPSSSDSSKAEFWDKARRRAAAFYTLFQICESMPHQESGGEGGPE